MSEESSFDPLNPFETAHFPIEDWADGIKDWAIEHRVFFRGLRKPLDWVVNNTEAGLLGAPQLAVLAGMGLVAWQAAGWRVGLLVVALMSAMGMMGENSWALGMTTLAVVVSAVVVCAVVGFPLGLWSAKSDRCEAVLRPILDTMQTIPAFVYLIPVVILFGIGNVPGVIVTVVFAMPPLIRLTALGLRQVNPHVVEAMRAFGATPRQILFKVEAPLAVPTIMAGLNQTLLLCLSMVVIAALISVKGFGNEVLRGMGRLDMGKAIVGGFGIVIMAIALDRITQGLARTDRERGCRHWHEQGPAGVIWRLWRRIDARRRGAKDSADSSGDSENSASARDGV